jgi:hypothetical protein
MRTGSYCCSYQLSFNISFPTQSYFFGIYLHFYYNQSLLTLFYFYYYYRCSLLLTHQQLCCITHSICWSHHSLLFIIIIASSSHHHNRCVYVCFRKVVKVWFVNGAGVDYFVAKKGGKPIYILVLFVCFVYIPRLCSYFMSSSSSSFRDHLHRVYSSV